MMLLECKNLSVRYKDSDDYVFSDVNVALQNAETLILTGENGSGKSTFVNAIVGMPGEKCEVCGEVYICGTKIEQNNSTNMCELRRKTVSVMPQDVLGSFNPAQKIGIQLKNIIRLSQKVAKKDVKQHIFNLFDGLGFDDAEKILHSYPHELSVGMLARCMFAVSLSNEPKLLILDEPNASINDELKIELMRKTVEYQQKSRCGLIIITHHREQTDKFFENCKYFHMGENDD